MVEVRMVGREDALTVPQPARDEQGRMKEGNAVNGERKKEGYSRRRRQRALDGHRGEREPQEQRARVAHEDPRRVEVVPEEAEARAGDDRREHGRLGATERE